MKHARRHKRKNQHWTMMGFLLGSGCINLTYFRHDNDLTHLSSLPFCHRCHVGTNSFFLDTNNLSCHVGTKKISCHVLKALAISFWKLAWCWKTKCHIFSSCDVILIWVIIVKNLNVTLFVFEIVLQCFVKRKTVTNM